MKNLVSTLAGAALLVAVLVSAAAQSAPAEGALAGTPAAVAPAGDRVDPQWLQTLDLHTRVCRAVCGDDFANARPEMRDHLTCLDGVMRPVGLSSARSACTRFDGGPWAAARAGAWCIKVHHDVGRSDWKQAAQCVGLVPQADLGKEQRRDVRAGDVGHVVPR